MDLFARKDRYDVIMDVSPAVAAEWLTRNTHNRDRNETHINELAADMRRGVWKDTKEGISFDTNGVLQAGQHRLYAIVRSGATVRLRVFFNESPENIFVIDTKRLNRSNDAIMSLAGGLGKVGKQELSTLRMMIRGLNARNPMTLDEEYEAMTIHRDAVLFAHKILPSVKGLGNMRTRAVFARAFYSVDHAKLESAASALIRGATSPDEQPLLKLRDYLLQGCSRKKAEAGRQTEYAKTEKALVAYLRGDIIRDRLTEISGEAFPLPNEISAKQAA